MGVRKLFAALVDLVLPGGCPGCGKPTDPALPWCPRCSAAVGPGGWARTHLPGGPVVCTVGRYTGPLRTALLSYKERGRRDLAGPLAGLLAALLDGQQALRGAGVRTVWLVPAPSRPAAARARGGDHVLRLCLAMAAGRDDNRVVPALRLSRHARDSVGLDAAQRAANLGGRVRVRPGPAPAPGVCAVLVDDVVTTGATLRACRDALGRCGIRVDLALVLCDATPR